ncbi:MAG: hypothetical protein WCJ30_23855, partial [Deltaproteobacteria bacterium]
ETYRILLVPMQDADTAGGASGVSWEDETLSLSTAPYDRAIENVTREREWVIGAWAPAHLHALLGKWFWKADRPSISIRRVWLDTCRYLYMPRLKAADVFKQTVQDGIRHRDFFGYAATEKEPAKFAGLLFGAGGTVYLDDAAMLVRPEEAAIAIEPAPGPTPGSNRPPVDGTSTKTPAPSKTGGGTAVASTPAAALHRRFHATVSIDASDPIGSFGEAVQNVIEHFTAQYGTEVEITVDIEARRTSGFDVKTVRVVRENAATLKFRTAEFEEE